MKPTIVYQWKEFPKKTYRTFYQGIRKGKAHRDEIEVPEHALVVEDLIISHKLNESEKEISKPD